jgi:uncharacterized protein YndB with AHSA1/START domain
MSPTPTGSVVRTVADRYDLILVRRFEAPIDDVWASVTESERTAGWFGPWRGSAGVGSTIELQMGFEEGLPWMEVRIDECRAPEHLAVSAIDESGEWHLELNLAAAGGVTTLEFAQRRVEPAAIESTGPGWEFYLDQLVAARQGRPLPSFDTYYPAQAEYYRVATDQAMSALAES